MPDVVWSCGLCRYWEPPVEGVDTPNWGECARLIGQDSPLGVSTMTWLRFGDIVTRRDFGCTQFQPDLARDA